MNPDAISGIAFWHQVMRYTTLSLFQWAFVKEIQLRTVLLIDAVLEVS